ncbi:MAG: GAF domain-containing protein [Aggregatilineales bacterium]
MNAKPAPAQAADRHRPLYAAAVVLTASAALVVASPWGTWGAVEWVALLSCVAVLAYIERTSRRFSSEYKRTYTAMAALGSGLTLGLAAGLLALALGLSLGALLDARQPGPAAGDALRQLAERLATLGLALLSAGALYAALGGDLPLRELSLRAALALLAAFALATAVAQALVRVMANQPAQPLELLALLQPSDRLQIAAALLVTVLAPLVLHQVGLIAFLLVQGLIVIQIERHARADDISRSLERRVQELALLTSVSQASAATLVLDDVLIAIYRHVSALIELRALYIALHNTLADALDFRLVMVDGAPALWPSRSVSAGHAPERAVRAGQVVHLVLADTPGTAPPEPNAAGLSYRAYLCLPLMIGSHALGALAVLSVSADAFTPEVINTLQAIASQAALAVRNAMLFAQRSELVEGLSFINDSVQNVLFNPKREQALQAACQTAMAITNASRSAVYLVQTNGAALILESSIGLSAAFQEQAREIVLQPALYSSGPRVVDDISQQAAGAHLAAEGIVAYAEMPLISADGLRGLLAVYHSTPHVYTQTELHLLEALANQITAMLENTELIRLLERYAFEMMQLVDLSRISAASTDLETVVNNVAQAIRDMTGVSRVTLLLLDAENQRVQALTACASGAAGGGETSRYLNPFPELEALAAAEHNDLGIFYTASPDLSSALAAEMAQHGERTAALVPLRAAGAFLGAMLLGSAEREGFSQREQQLLAMAANQIAVHIRNVQLYEQTRADLDRRLEQLSVAEELARQVSSSLDFNQIIGSVLDAALRATQADAATLALLADAGQLRVIEQRLENGVPVRVESAQPRDAGLLGQVLKVGRPVRLPDDTLFAALPSSAPGRYRSSLAVPLFNGEDVVGVLNVESAQRDFFTERQASFLASLAAHAVTSIENARLLAEREHQIGMLTSLRTLSLRLASADSTRAVAAAVLETGQAMLRAACGIAYRYNEATASLTALASSGLDGGSSLLDKDPLVWAIVLQALEKRQLQFVPNLSALAAAAGESAPAYTSAVAVPLERHNQTIYVLWFGFLNQRSLQDRDLHTIELLSSQAVGHLDNALLHEQLRAGRDQMRAILDSARAGMILLDTAFCLEAVNPSAERLLGIRLEPHLGSYFPDVLAQTLESGAETGYTREEIAELARILWEQPEITTRRQFYHRRHNQLVYIEEVGSPVLNNGGRIIGRLLVLQDMTEAKLLDEHREDLMRMLIHDLRGPLGAIINGIDSGLYALNTLPDWPDYAANLEETRALLRASHISATRLLRLVSSLLDVARLEARQIQLNQLPVALASVAQTAYTALAATVQQAHINVLIEMPADLPPALADRDIVERVVINLLDNAVRYTPAGGVVRISACQEGNVLRLYVADSGPGVPPQAREHIFEKFGRVQNNAPLRGASGLGLGLTFCKLAVEAHGGRIWVDDNPGGGSVFSFTLPAATTDQSRSAEELRAP